MGERAGPGSVLDTLADAPGAAALLRFAALFRRPVERAGLIAAVARVDPDGPIGGAVEYSVPVGFTESMRVLEERGLLARMTAGDADEDLFEVPAWVGGNLPPIDDDEDDLRAAHSRLARFWGWRATRVSQDVADLVEARHHHLAAGETRDATSLTCAIADLWREGGQAAQAEPLLVEALGRVRPETEEEAEVLYRLGTVRALAGRYADARQLYERCLDIAIDAGDVETVNHAVFALASVAHGVGEFAEADGLYERALPVFEAAGDEAAAAACRQALAAMAVRRGDYGAALPAIEAAIAAAADDEQLGEALHQKGVASHWRGDFATARQVLGEALAAAQRAGDDAGRSIVRLQLGSVAVETGDLAEARAQCAAVRGDLGGDDPRIAAHADVLDAAVAWLSGDLDGVERAAARALRRADGLGDSTARASERGYLGLAAHERGDVGRALESFRAAQTDGEIAGFPAVVAMMQAHSAAALDQRGDTVEADALRAQAAQTFARIGHEAAVGWAACEESESRRRRGDLPAARAALERAAEVFRRVDTPVGRTAVALEEGRLRAAEGDRAGARERLAEALETARRLGLGTPAAQAESALAALALEEGRPDEALPPLAAAVGRWVAQRSRHLAQDLGRLAAVRRAVGDERFTAALAAAVPPTLAERIRAALDAAPGEN